MDYFQVIWKHQNPEYPTVILTEMDAERWEHRKVERWADGRVGHADYNGETGGTGLGTEPWPGLETLATDPEFDVRPITKV